MLGNELIKTLNWGLRPTKCLLLLREFHLHGRFWPRKPLAIMAVAAVAGHRFAVLGRNGGDESTVELGSWCDKRKLARNMANVHSQIWLHNPRIVTCDTYCSLCSHVYGWGYPSCKTYKPTCDVIDLLNVKFIFHTYGLGFQAFLWNVLWSVMEDHGCSLFISGSYPLVQWQFVSANQVEWLHGSSRILCVQ